MNLPKITMNGGEITPRLWYRSDMEKNQSGLARCHNFLPTPYGEVTKRQGTAFVADLSYCTGKEQLHQFLGSDGKRYVLIFTPTRFMAWDIAGASLHSQALAWTLTTDTMPTLRVTILNDVIFLTSPSFHPLKLTYTSGTSWALEKVTFREPPYLDENLELKDKISVLSNPVATTWANSTSYTVGNTRLNTEGTCEYECITAHTSGTSSKPGTGSTWRTYWKIKTYAKNAAITLKTHLGVTAWANATGYLVDAYVTYNGNTYVCTVAHTSATGTNEPGAEFIIGIIWTKLATIFRSTHVVSDTTYTPAATYAIRQARDPNNSESEIRLIDASDGKYSPEIIVGGGWALRTYGLWRGTITLQKSLDNGTTFTTVRTFESSTASTGVTDAGRNFDAAGEETEPCIMRMLADLHADCASTGDARAVLSPEDIHVRSQFSVYTYTSANEVTAYARTLAISGTTEKWSESAFNRFQGWPIACTFHDRRLVYAGTTLRPLSLWLSAVEDFLDFEQGTEDSNAFFVTIASDDQSPIRWITSQRRLFVGTQNAEWIVGSESQETPTTPSDFIARQYTSYGSAALNPLKIGSAVVFVQRHARRIREMAGALDQESYDAADLTRLAEHIFQTNTIVQIAWMQSREPMLLVIDSAGGMAIFTYISSERVFAWSTHSTLGGTFKSVCVVRTATDTDTAYFIVSRNGHYVLESWQLEGNTGDVAWASSQKGFDCWRTTNIASLPTNAPTDSTGIITNANLSYWSPAGYLLANAVEDLVFAQGASMTTANATVGTHHYGALVTGYITTLPIDSPDTIGRKKNVWKARAHVRWSNKLEIALTAVASPAYSTLAASFDSLPYNVTESRSTSALYSGWQEANVNLSGPVVWLAFRHAHPVPCTITALVAEIDVKQP